MGRVQRLGTLLLIVLVFGAFVGLSPAAAQSKEARGTVTAVTDSSLKVKVGAQEMTFAVDGKTAVLARGAGRATRDAQATGAPGIKIGDAIKPGGAVIVQYTEAGGKMTATEVRAVSDAGEGGGSVSTTAAPPSKSVTGKVKSATANSLVVTADNKDMTFAVSPETKVEAKGAGTATQAAGGRIAFNTLVGAGDTVQVTYQEAGATMRATEVRITIKVR
jgi:hypothetical protein